jgi:hypothetical protein
VDELAILGKDLFHYSDNFFEFTALFASDEIEINERSYKYSEITTGILNFDFTEYKAIMKELELAHCNGDEVKYTQSAKMLNEIIKAMPLFSDFKNRHNLLDAVFYNPFFQKEKPSNPYKNLDGYIALGEDLDLIQRRYKWFLVEMFYRTFPAVKTNRYAYAIENNGVGAFVSGISLGESSDVDPANSSIQYEIRISKVTGLPQLFEKMAFKRLSDFIYVEFFKSLMNENVPKKCKSCGNYFLQEKGFSYEYCDCIAPNEIDKTCRDIGSTKSFQDKVKNSQVWTIHQRAYKKYYARVMKKKMTKPDFMLWAENAESLRDKALVGEMTAEDFEKEINKV